MKKLTSMIIISALFAGPAMAKTAQYGGVSKTICDKRGCHQNPNYERLMKARSGVTQ